MTRERRRLTSRPDVLDLDAERSTEEIVAALRELVGPTTAPPGRGRRALRRHRQQRSRSRSARARSGRSACSALLMPERDSVGDTLRAQPARSPTRFGVDDRARGHHRRCSRRRGCYERRDEAIRQMIPEYGAGWKSKIVLPRVLDSRPLPALLGRRASRPTGEQHRGAAAGRRVPRRSSPRRTSSSARARCSSTTTPTG